MGGVASLTVWIVRNSACVAEASSCAEFYNLTKSMIVVDSNPAQQGAGGLSPVTFCQDLFLPSPGVLPAGLLVGNVTGSLSSSNVDNCVICVNRLTGCVEPTLPILVSGVLLLVFSLFPCMYCCCCSAKPVAAAKYF